MGEDIRKLEFGVQVVSGTPGRVCDMIKRRTLRTRAIKLLVLVSLGALQCVSLVIRIIIVIHFLMLFFILHNFIFYYLLLQDESDEMLSRGFKDQIYDVYRYLPPELQVLSLSLKCL